MSGRGGGTIVDVEIVKFTMPAKADQKVVAERLVGMEQIRKRFSTCAALPAIVKEVSGATRAERQAGQYRRISRRCPRRADQGQGGRDDAADHLRRS